ncbi:MAG: hypothetical protein KAU29_02255, partial [Gammaproteobacteria bacterium]|nr:hypothetical protein [Gammaproteobacteria bacterium]
MQQDATHVDTQASRRKGHYTTTGVWSVSCGGIARHGHVHQVQRTVGEQATAHVAGDVAAHRAVRHGHGDAGSSGVGAAADSAIVTQRGGRNATSTGAGVEYAATALGAIAIDGAVGDCQSAIIIDTAAVCVTVV